MSVLLYLCRMYIVPTPVGNMEDMTLRAIRVLKEADLILAEDTRTSGVLLSHYDIHTPVLSHHKYNEHESVKEFVARLQAGATIALVSDAGTPALATLDFCWCVKQLRMVWKYRRCLAQLLLCLLWLVADCHAISLSSKVSCHRRRDVRHV